MIKNEIDFNNNDTKRINMIVETEEDLQTRKMAEEKRIVKLVGDDIKE